MKGGGKRGVQRGSGMGVKTAALFCHSPRLVSPWFGFDGPRITRGGLFSASGGEKKIGKICQDGKNARSRAAFNCCSFASAGRKSRKCWSFRLRLGSTLAFDLVLAPSEPLR